jgi:hypothetical protein
LVVGKGEVGRFRRWMLVGLRRARPVWTEPLFGALECCEEALGGFVSG